MSIYTKGRDRQRERKGSSGGGRGYTRSGRIHLRNAHRPARPRVALVGRLANVEQRHPGIGRGSPLSRRSWGFSKRAGE